MPDRSWENRALQPKYIPLFNETCVYIARESKCTIKENCNAFMAAKSSSWLFMAITIAIKC